MSIAGVGSEGERDKETQRKGPQFPGNARKRMGGNWVAVVWFRRNQARDIYTIESDSRSDTVCATQGEEKWGKESEKSKFESCRRQTARRCK